MHKDTKALSISKESLTWSPLEEIVRNGARSMLQAALEAEINEFIEQHKESKDESGKQLVVKNGYHPEREITTGIGKISVKQPRVDDRNIRTNKAIPVFTSKILPRFLRRIPSIDNLLPVLYLKGISTKDFSSAFESILGPGAKNLSSNVIVRLKAKWEQEYEEWRKRDLSDKEYVYFWADGIYCNARLEGERSCLLVIIAATKEGKKEFLGVIDGVRESKLSWKELLLKIKNRGLKIDPKLAIGDGALGFWSALREVFPGTKEQRCWVHKTANVLDKMPKKLHVKAKSLIHEIYKSDNKSDALSVYNEFVQVYQDKYPKAAECLIKDIDELLSFYDFPAKHWSHIRTTNPIESTFATIRLRTKRTKGCATRKTTLTMIYKLGIEAEKNWSRLKGYKLIPLLFENKKFIDGVLEKEEKAA